MSEPEGIALVRAGPDLLTPAITEEEIKYRDKRLYNDKNLFKQALQCTACEKSVKEKIQSGSVYVHPFLKVLLCNACHQFYGDGEFSADEDGSDKYCRWCGQGGNLYCCSHCSVAVCLKCVKRNFGKSYLKEIEADDWKCFICDTKPIWKQRALCAAAENYVEQRYAKKSKRPRTEVESELQKSKRPKKESCTENESDESVFMDKNTSNWNYTSSEESSHTLRKSPRKRHGESARSEESHHQSKKSNRKDDDESASSKESPRLTKKLTRKEYGENASSEENLHKSKKSIRQGRDDNIESENFQSKNQRKLIVHVIKDSLNDFEKLTKVMEKSSKAYSEKYLKNEKFLKSAHCSEILKNKFVVLLENSKKSIERLERNFSDFLKNMESCSDGSKTEDDKTEDEQKSECLYEKMEVDEEVSHFAAGTTGTKEVSATADNAAMDTTNDETVSATSDTAVIDTANTESISAIADNATAGTTDTETVSATADNPTASATNTETVSATMDSAAASTTNTETVNATADNATASATNTETVSATMDSAAASTTNTEAVNATADNVTVDTTNAEFFSAIAEPITEEPTCANIAIAATDTIDDKNMTSLKSSEEEVNLSAAVNGDKESSCGDEQFTLGTEDETNLDGASLIVHLDESKICSEENDEEKPDKIEKIVSLSETNDFKNSSTPKTSEVDTQNSSLSVNEKENAENVSSVSKDEEDHKDSETSLSIEDKLDENSTSPDDKKSSVVDSPVKEKKVNGSVVTESVSKLKNNIAKKALLNSSDGTSSGNESNTKSEESGMSGIDSLKSDSNNAEQLKKRKRKEFTQKEKLMKEKLMLDSNESEDDKEINRLTNLKSLKRRSRRFDSSGDSAEASADEKEEATEKNKLKTGDSNEKPSSKKKKTNTSLMDYINNDSEEGDGTDDDNIGGYFSEFNSFIENKHNKNMLSKDEISKKLLFHSLNSDDADSEDNGDILLESTRNEQKNELKTEKVKEESDIEVENNNPLGKKKRDRKWRKDKLLQTKLVSSDTSDEESACNKDDQKEAKSKKVEWQSSEEEVNGDTSGSEDLFRTKKPTSAFKRRRPQFSSSESNKEKSDSDSVTIISDVDSSSNKKKLKKRKRIKGWSNSEDSDKDTKDDFQSGSAAKGRKNIRKLLDDDDLEEATRKTTQEEEERKKRIAQRQALFNQSFKIVGSDETTPESIILDFDPQTKEAIISVHPRLVKKLKPHQAKGVKFMWDSCFESIKQIENSKGGGCILAHCMGLGKTLQVIALVHTVLRYEETKVKRVLILCPLSTVQNWINEFDMWLKNVPEYDFSVDSLLKYKNNNHRADYLRQWYREGGVMVMGYEMFRNLVNTSKLKKSVKAKASATFNETLLDPGPELVICDEGHMLKNESTAISQATMKIRTLRRIVLTGTPLQNNLKEYHCMVQFVKPNLLGTRKEFLNRFANPITNGQYIDSTVRDVRLMKRRSHVLHKLLDGILQRFDYNVLTPFLPPKFEYVISVAVSDLQAKLYEHYIKTYSVIAGHEKSSLFKDYQIMRLIWTHPFAMKRSLERAMKRKSATVDSDDSLKDFVVSGSDVDESSNDSDASILTISSVGSKKSVKKRATRSTKPDLEELKEENEEEDLIADAWWRDFISDEDFDNYKLGPKLVLLFAILKECEEIGDKVLIFSQSIPSLDMIEYFLQKTDELSQYASLLESSHAGYLGKWVKNCDYFRLDGQTSTELRTRYCNSFNKSDNLRSRLFLISTKAGGLGINLTAANRVIIFDASWNPSHDVQSIFRVYRFGQNKPCYIYRFLAQGTMEEKIYERQVTKLSISCRVVDEQQIDRHFSRSEIVELYTFNRKIPLEDETPMLPKDRLMAELLKKYKQIILSYHEHDSLLENIVDEELTEEERKMAWEEFENDKKPKIIASRTDPNMITDEAILEALKREHPAATEAQLKDMFYQVRLKLMQHYNFEQMRMQNLQWQMNPQKQINPSKAQSAIPKEVEEMRRAAYIHQMQMLNQKFNTGTANTLPQPLNTVPQSTSQSLK